MTEYTVIVAFGGRFYTRVGCRRTSRTAGEALRVHGRGPCPHQLRHQIPQWRRTERGGVRSVTGSFVLMLCQAISRRDTPLYLMREPEQNFGKYKAGFVFLGDQR